MLKKWFFIIRPFTLCASISPVLVGIAVASCMTKTDWLIASVTIFCALGLQILSNLINDWLDFKKGADSTERLGPKRAISEGVISEKELKTAILITLLLVILSGAYLLYVGKIIIAAIGISAIFFAWLYSATSYSLSALGIADFFTLSYFGFIASWGTTYLLTHTHSTTSLLLGLGCGAISTAILTTNNIRDVHADKAVNKKTLIVRFGTLFGKIYYALMILLPIIVAIITLSSLPIALFLTAATIPLFVIFLKSTGKGYNKVLMFTGFYDLFYALLIVLFCAFGGVPTL